VIEILAEQVDGLERNFAISGGQRRDWIFSGPVAHRLGLAHVSLYKQQPGEEDKVELVYADGSTGDISMIEGCTCVHIVDLITQGSSVYRTEAGLDKGWIPMLRNKGLTVPDLIAVVSRKQGGEEMLKGKEVQAHPSVSIDEAFLEEHSRFPTRALAYFNNPKAWSETYLRSNGTLAFVGAFDPEGAKLPRAKQFLQRYKSVLHQRNGLTNQFNMVELDSEVQERYGKPLVDIVGRV